VVVVSTREGRLAGTVLRLHLRVLHLLRARLCSLSEKSLEDSEEVQAMKIPGFGQTGVIACAAALAVMLVGLGGDAKAQFDELIPSKAGLVKFSGSR